MGSVDTIIEQLLAVRSAQPGSIVDLAEHDIRMLCSSAKDLFLSEPSLLRIPAPTKLVGDIHGQYYDLLRVFDYCGYPEEQNFLFLGDYVDRGRQGLECICLLLAYKIKYPKKVFMIRGNHEQAGINRLYGFHEECKRRYNVRLWKQFQDVFDCLPIAAVLEDAVFCIHGGLSPTLESLDDINQISRPTEVPETGLLCDCLWADPDPKLEGWGENDRGISYTFGPDVVEKFLDKHELDLMVRAHQVVEGGYEFFAGRQLVTLFSAPNYCGEFDNAGAVMSIDENLTCSFQVLKPSMKKQTWENRPATPGDRDTRMNEI